MSELPRLLVVFNTGSAGPQSIARAAAGLCQVVFAVDRTNNRVEARLDEITASGEVCDITGLDERQQRNRIAAYSIDAITTFSDSQILRTAALAEDLDLRFLSCGVAELVTDKFRQRAALRAAGVDTTRTAPVRSLDDLAPAAETVGFPAVLKPRRGLASIDTFWLHSVDQAERVLRHLVESGSFASQGYVLEELLVGNADVAGEYWGDYVSVESVIKDGTVQHLLVTGKTALTYPFRETGQFAPSTLSPQWHKAVCASTEKSIQALGIAHGTTHTEIKLTAGGPRIIEVNGRLGGYLEHMLIQPQAGWNIVRASLKSTLGLAPDVPSSPEKVVFSYFPQPPADSRRLLDITGIEAVRAMSGVTRFDVRKAPGDPVHWRKGTANYLGLVYGWVDDHAALKERIDDIDARIGARYASSDDAESPGGGIS